MLEGMSDDFTPLSPPEGTASIDVAAQVISILADFGFGIAVLEGVRVLRRKQTPLRAAMRLGIVGLSVFGVNTVLKKVFDRERPEAAPLPNGMVRTPRSASFPSGHTLAATASAVALPTSGLGVAAGLSGASLVGWSRVRLGAHHKSDVVGGLVLGAGLGALLRLLLTRLERE